MKNIKFYSKADSGQRLNVTYEGLREVFLFHLPVLCHLQKFGRKRKGGPLGD